MEELPLIGLIPSLIPSWWSNHEEEMGLETSHLDTMPYSSLITATNLTRNSRNWAEASILELVLLYIKPMSLVRASPRFGSESSNMKIWHDIDHGHRNPISVLLMNQRNTFYCKGIPRSLLKYWAKKSFDVLWITGLILRLIENKSSWWILDPFESGSLQII